MESVKRPPAKPPRALPGPVCEAHRVAANPCPLCESEQRLFNALLWFIGGIAILAVATGAVAMVSLAMRMR